MKIYGDKIGPVEYFRGIGLTGFLMPYAMGVPRFWPVCVLITIGALWFIGRAVKKEEVALHAAKSGDPRITKMVMLFAVLMISNAGLIHLLR